MATRASLHLPAVLAAAVLACHAGAGSSSSGPHQPPPGCAPATAMPAYPWPAEGLLGPLTGGTLEACGWPGPGNTGPAPGTAFTACADLALSPPNVVHRDGAECWLEIRSPLVLSGVRGITGVYMTADLTLRDVILEAVDGGTPGDVGMVNVQSGTTFTAERVRLDGGAHTGERGIYGAGGAIVVRSSELLHCGAACVEGDRWEVRDSYLHDFVGIQGNHVDGLQIGGGGPVVAVHNTIIALNAYFDDTVGPVPNSTLGLWAELGDTSGVTIERNLLAGGGGTVYLQEKAPYRMTDARFAGNVLSTAYYPHGGEGWVGYYGPLYPTGIPASLVWEDNTILETGAPLGLIEAIDRW
jgi:hypothetical protein